MPLSFASCEILSVARRGIAKPAAYAERRILADETGAVLFRPRRHDDAVAGFTLLPRDASPRFDDPRTLWDAVERRSQSSRSRVVGLAFVLGLPREEELTLAECIPLVRRFADLLHCGRLPVRADIHRVVDGDGNVAHRHAHLTVGLYPVEGSEIGRALERRWLPVVRSKLVHALDWSMIWTQVQADFFLERDLELAVPPASGQAEPKVKGRPKRGSKTALAGRTRQEALDDVRAERLRRSSEPALVLRILTRSQMIVSLAELQAFLASAGHGPEAVANLTEAVLAHEDTVHLGSFESEVLDEGLFTCRTALERAAAIFAAIGKLKDVTATLVPMGADTLPELREIVTRITAASDPDRRLVVLWSDSWLRREVESGVAWPRGCRQIAARHLSELDDRDAAVLHWSPKTVVLVLSADRLQDADVEILIRRVTDAGSALWLGVVLDGPVPRLDRRIAPLLVEHVLGTSLPLASDAAISLQILQQRLGWRSDDRDLRSPRSAAHPALIRSGRPYLGASPEGTDERVVAARLAALTREALTPREAWANPPQHAEVMVQRVSDWLWAGSLLRQYPHLEIRFDIEESDHAFIAAVTDRMRGLSTSLRLLVERLAANVPELEAVPDSKQPSEPEHPADDQPIQTEADEHDGLDRDTDLDAEAVAERHLNEHEDVDADHNETHDEHEYEVDEFENEDPQPEF